jgi:hypothetical protein
MKNLFATLFLLPFLLSLPMNKTHLPATHSTARVKGSCAAPYGYTARKSGSTIYLTWSGSASSYTVGGYYNYVTGTKNFGGPASGTSYQITDPTVSSAYSIHFNVTSICSDGTTTNGTPVFYNL